MNIQRKLADWEFMSVGERRQLSPEEIGRAEWIVEQMASLVEELSRIAQKGIALYKEKAK